MRKLLAVSFPALLIALVVGFAFPATARSPRPPSLPSAFKVTITNLTDGQPLTPPVVALHRRPVDVFTVEQPASFELKEIAKNSNNAPLLAVLGSSRGVADFAEGAGGTGNSACRAQDSQQGGV